MFVVTERWLFSREVTVSHCQVARKLLRELCKVLANDSLITSVASNTHGQQMGMKGSCLYKKQQHCYFMSRPFQIQRMDVPCSRSALYQVRFAGQRPQDILLWSYCLKLLKIWAVNTWSAVFSVDHPSSHEQSPGILRVAQLALCRLWLPAFIRPTLILPRIWFPFKHHSCYKALCLFLLWVEISVTHKRSQKYLSLFLPSWESRKKAISARS